MRTRERLRAWFPPPLVGVALLLVALIIFTPNLLSSGSPAAGTYPTQAELIVDRGPAEPNLTHLYVKSVGDVRYSNLSMSLAVNVSWPVSSITQIDWHPASYLNDSLYISSSTTENPLAVNVTATYIDTAGGYVVYSGVYAFYFQGSTVYTQPLISTETTIPPTSVSALPLYILLSITATGGP